MVEILNFLRQSIGPRMETTQAARLKENSPRSHRDTEKTKSKTKREHTEMAEATESEGPRSLGVLAASVRENRWSCANGRKRIHKGEPRFKKGIHNGVARQGFERSGVGAKSGFGLFRENPCPFVTTFLFARRSTSGVRSLELALFRQSTYT